MGTSMGCVRFNDGMILYASYQNTSDVMSSRIWKSFAESLEGRPNGEVFDSIKCHCGQDEPVLLATNYGGGFYWSGRACRHCMAITKGDSPYAIESPYGTFDIVPGPDFYKDGIPDWWPDD